MTNAIGSEHRKWVANRPQDWKIKRFKEIFSERNDRSETGEEVLLSVSAYTGVTPRSDLVDDGDLLSRADTLVDYKRCYTNDLVMNIMLAWNKGLAFTKLNGIVSPAYAVFKVKSNDDPRFLDYLLRDDETNLYFKAYSTGIIDSRLRLYPEVFGQMYCSLPDINTQSLIANFLDEETAKIDELIKKQQQLITLIIEKQQSEVLTCVTKGITPATAFKNSTNIWLKELPAHWGEGNLKVLSKIYSGGTPDKSKLEYWTNGTIPWLNSGSVNDFYIYNPSEYITEEALNNSSAKWIPKGSILVALAGQGKTKGMAAQLMFDSTCNQSMCAILPSEKINGNYLHWWLSSNYQNIRNLAGGDLRDGLNLEMIGSIKCPIPPIGEQLEISNHLSLLREKNLELIEKCMDSIKLLKEHRASLISHAVTGKIDVREAA